MIREDLIKEISYQTGIEIPIIDKIFKKLRQITIETLRYGEGVQFWQGLQIDAKYVPDHATHYNPAMGMYKTLPAHYEYKASLSRHFKKLIRNYEELEDEE